MLRLNESLVNKICFIDLVIACIISCNQRITTPITKHCDANVCTFPQSQTEVKTPVSQDNWKFSLIGDGWETIELPSLGIKNVNKNELKNCSLMFIKEPTTDTYSEYVIASIRTFSAQYSHINEVDQVIINDNNFVKVAINNDSTIVWTWISMKNGFGYGFICGGDVDIDAGNSVHDLCQEIAKTIEIK